MTKEAVERSFDELASGLASGSLSRGRALKLMGAALVGSALAFIPGVAQARRPCTCREGTRCCFGTRQFSRVPPLCCSPDRPVCCHCEATGSLSCAESREVCEAAGCRAGRTFPPS
jgi:hypothetical protein